VNAPVIAVPDGAPEWLLTAVRDGGARLGPLEDADALVYVGAKDAIPTLPDTVRWVQLPNAGIETYLHAGVIDDRRVWTSAAGAYSDTVAEHAVGLLLAGVRGLVTAARLVSWDSSAVGSRITGLAGSTIALIGAGGIGRRAIALLEPFGVSVIAVNRSGRPVEGAVRTLAAEHIDQLWSAGVDHVLVAAPATDASHHVVGRDELAALKPTSWVVNIARGSLVDTDALVAALAEGRIAGAALDVTDPEPLPDGHPLWTSPGVLITPHTANPSHRARVALAARVRDNVARFVDGRDLLGVIDTGAGY
jgi:D-3-phosphoglycerate dehydrogenase